MSKIEFGQDTIILQVNASDWGPFNFNFSEALPSGYDLTGCTVKSYLGRVKPEDSDDLSGFTETTSEIINTTAVVGVDVTTVTFDYPSTEAWQDQSHTLIFYFTITGGGTHSAFFYRVRVL
jgi:hypothetical protein